MLTTNHHHSRSRNAHSSPLNECWKPIVTTQGVLTRTRHHIRSAEAHSFMTSTINSIAPKKAKPIRSDTKVHARATRRQLQEEKCGHPNGFASAQSALVWTKLVIARGCCATGVRCARTLSASKLSSSNILNVYDLAWALTEQSSKAFSSRLEHWFLTVRPNLLYKSCSLVQS